MMIFNELKKLKNVIKVKKLPIKTKIFVDIKEQYFVYFKQPLDWNHPEKGTFVQKVRVGFNDFNNYNTIYLGGYDDVDWQDQPKENINNWEIQKKFKANIIQIEYRNFGSSVLNKNKYDLKYCQYLTCKNAIKDFKFILDQFKTIWKNKWIAAGWSKGGLTTMQLSAFFPNCCDLFVPYVSVGKVQKDDRALMKHVYTKIGKTCLGNNEQPIDVEKYRKTITFFQLYLLENREYFSRAWINYAKKEKYEFTEYGKNHFDLIYNSMIVDFCYLNFWQYRLKDEIFDELDNLLSIKDETKQRQAIKKYWLGLDQVSDWVLTGDSSNPYWYQNYIGQGYYSFDPSPLVNCILKYSNKYTSKDIWEKLLNHPKKYIVENAKDFLYKNNLTPEQYEQARFDQSEVNVLLPWYENCSSNVIFINGKEDPWYQSFRNLKRNLKPSKNIKEFLLDGQSHYARISYSSKDIQKDFWQRVDNILKKEEK